VNADPDANFCRACGSAQAPSDADAQTEIAATNGWPQTGGATAVLDAPITTAHSEPVRAAAAVASPAPGRSRPLWLLLTVPTAALALFAGIGAFVLLSRGHAGPSFAQRATGVLAPVVTADGDVDLKLQMTHDGRDLAAVRTAAEAARQATVKAQGAVTVLEASSKDARTKALLDQALGANQAYLDKITEAATALTPLRAASAVTAARQAAQSFSTLATTTPTVTLPTDADFGSVEQLQTLAAAQAKAAAQRAVAARAKAQTRAAERSYVNSIDALLENSSETRANLGSLITDIENDQLSPTQASAQIASIINQRQDLQNQVAAVAAPARFRLAAEKLRDSIAAALDDDYAIQGWINGWYDADLYAYERSYSQHEQATARATAAKSDFLALYNQLRAERLQLQPLDVNY
jgi:hypothetical protein